MQTKIIFPGSFQILHHGHLACALYAENLYNTPTLFEICEKPYDKPALTEEEKQKRKGQFDILGREVVFTDCSSFTQKSMLFDPRKAGYRGTIEHHVMFIVGSDTLSRIQNPKYYYDDEAEMLRCFNIIKDNASFLAFARPNKIDVHPSLEEIVTWADFKAPNISSTELRNMSYLEKTFGPFEKEEVNIEDVPFGKTILINNDIGKVVRGTVPFGGNFMSIKEVTVQKNEEFFKYPFGTKVRVQCLPVNS